MSALARLQTTLACVLASVRFAWPAKGLGATPVVRNATADDVEHGCADVVEPDVGESVDCVAAIYAEHDVQSVSNDAIPHSKCRPFSAQAEPASVEQHETIMCSMMSSIPKSFSWSDIHTGASPASIASSFRLASTEITPTISKIVVESPLDVALRKYKSIDDVQSRSSGLAARTSSLDAEKISDRSLVYQRLVLQYTPAFEGIAEAIEAEEIEEASPLSGRSQHVLSQYAPALATIAEANETDIPESAMFGMTSSTASFSCESLQANSLTPGDPTEAIGIEQDDYASSPMLSSMITSCSWKEFRATGSCTSVAASISVGLVKTVPAIIVTSPSSPCYPDAEEDSEAGDFSFDHLTPHVRNTHGPAPSSVSLCTDSDLPDISEEDGDAEDPAGPVIAPAALSSVLVAAIEAEHAREVAQEQAVFGTFDYLRRLRAQEGPMNLCHAMDAIFATLPTTSALSSAPSLASVSSVVSCDSISDEAKAVIAFLTIRDPIPATSSASLPASISCGSIPDDTETKSATLPFSISYGTIPDEMDSTLIASVSSVTDMYAKITKAINGSGDLHALLKALVV